MEAMVESGMGNAPEAELKAIASVSALPSMLEVVCRNTGMRFAAVARVTADRWTACVVRDEINFGLKAGDDLPIQTTICHEIEQSHQAVIIDEVAADERFRGHHTPRLYGFQSYISMPILRSDGRFFGTLCALDPLPRKVSDARTVSMFESFAQLIGAQLEAEDTLTMTQHELADERKTGELREQFIAVIGHDLRNPLFATTTSAELLLRMTDLPEKARRLVNNIASSGQRMSGLVSNLLDFARGRLGGGFTLDRRTEAQLAEHLHAVVTELRAVHAQRQIDLMLQIDRPVYCDPARVAQIFSNLLANALLHGDAEQPVAVRAHIEGDHFELAVSNAGTPIPEDRRAQLFEPFVRSRVPHRSEGLGLGLYIASQLAHAHGGTLSVQSNRESTTFTLQIPHNESSA